METKNKRKKSIGIVVILIAFALSYFAMQQFFFNTSDFEKIMKEAAAELNDSCPIMVDSETRLDNAEVVSGHIFRYNYTLVNNLKSEIDSDGMRNTLEPALIENVSSSPGLQIYRENKITMAYYYYDRNGELAFNIVVSPDKYKN